MNILESLTRNEVPKEKESPTTSNIQYKNGRLRHAGPGFICPFSEAKSKTRLGAKTYKNMKIISDTFGVEWNTCYVVEVNQGRRWGSADKIVHSVCIVGTIGDKTIEYVRKETRSPRAGQTIICLNGKNRIKMTSILQLCNALNDKDIDKWVQGKTSDAATKREKNSHRVFSDELLKTLGEALGDEALGVLLLDNDKVLRRMGKLKLEDEDE